MSTALTTNVDLRKLRTTKFPAEFNEKVDMNKVNGHIIRKWMTDEITKILQSEDDIVTELISNMLENRYPNIKELQISLTGFLDKEAASFCRDLWKLCLSAQQSPQGIPKELLEAKKQELAQTRLEEEKAREEARIRQDAERERETELARIRERERHERRGRGGRYGREPDRRPRYESRSPPPRRRRDDDDFYRAPTSRGGDNYRPGGRPRGDRPPPRTRSASRSRSPPARRTRRPSISSSASRSPPPRRRAGSIDRSPSPNGDYSRRQDRRPHRSGKYRSRSPAPKRRRRRSSSGSSASRSRSPPSKATRRNRSSSSRRRSTQSDDGKNAADLMASSSRHAGKNGEGNGRLRRESSDQSMTRSATPPSRQASASAE